MRRYAAVLTLATLVSACGPAANPTPGASSSQAPSPATGASAAPGGASPAATTTPAGPATPQPPAPVTLKITVDGKPGNVEAISTYSLAPGFTTSVFWSIGALAKHTGNIGAGYGLLKEGEGHLTLHIKMPDPDGAFNLRTLTEAEYKGATSLIYKEGPKSYVWGANGHNGTGTFTVEGDTVTFKITATVPGNKRENDGTPRVLDVEVSGLPRPVAP